jgi:hypothetical protein
MGQAKAEHLLSGTVPNASSLNKSRSIDFVLSYDVPGGSGLPGNWCFKTSDQAEKGYGAATVDKLTHTLPVAGLRKIESRPRVRSDVWLFSAENAPARASTNHRSIVYGKAGERNDPNQKARTAFAKHARTDPTRRTAAPQLSPPSFYKPAAFVRLIVKRSRLRW